MDVARRIQALRALPQFRTLEEDALRLLAEAARERRPARGEWLFRQGDPADAFYVVCEGSVRLFRMRPGGQEQLLHRVKAGRSFAEAAALTMPSYPANCAALVDGTVVLKVDAKSFRKAFDRPQVARAVVAALSARLLHLVGRVEDLSINSASARLARHLLELPARPIDDGAGLEIPLPTTKRELAGHLGITPETLSRLLRKWDDAGWIRSERGAVVVLDTLKLLSVADDD